MPDPALPAWSHTWVDTAGESYRAAYDERVINMFRAASNERTRASMELNGFIESDILAALLPDLGAGDNSVDGVWGHPILDQTQTGAGNGITFRGHNTRSTPATWFSGTYDEEVDKFLTAIYNPRYQYEAMLPNIANTGDCPNGIRALVTQSSVTGGTNTGKIFLKTGGVWAYDPPANEDSTDPNYGNTNALEYRDGSGTYAILPAYTDLGYGGNLFNARWLNEVRDLIGMQVLYRIPDTVPDPTTQVWIDTSYHTNWGYGSGATQDDAVAAATASFNSGDNISFIDFSTSDPDGSTYGASPPTGYPGGDASCWISGYEDPLVDPPSQFECFMSRTSRRFKIIHGATTKTYEVNLSMFAATFGDAFNANGDPVIDSAYVPGVHEYLKTVWSGTGGPGATSPTIGDHTAVPALPSVAATTAFTPLPVPGHNYTSYFGSSGYDGTLGACYLNFRVTGGFDYVI